VERRSSRASEDAGTISAFGLSDEVVACRAHGSDRVAVVRVGQERVASVCAGGEVLHKGEALVGLAVSDASVTIAGGETVRDGRANGCSAAGRLRDAVSAGWLKAGVTSERAVTSIAEGKSVGGNRDLGHANSVCTTPVKCRSLCQRRSHESAPWGIRVACRGGHCCRRR